MLPALDHEVPGLNPTQGRIQLMTTVLYCIEPFIIPLPLSIYDLPVNDVEREVIITIRYVYTEK